MKFEGKLKKGGRYLTKGKERVEILFDLREGNCPEVFEDINKYPMVGTVKGNGMMLFQWSEDGKYPSPFEFSSEDIVEILYEPKGEVVAETKTEYIVREI